MKAALCNCRESVMALLAAGADPAAALPSGLSANLWAHWHAVPACLDVLFAYGAKLMEADETGLKCKASHPP